MTNRELLQKAMPLVSLSKEEWTVFLRHIEETKQNESDVCGVLETISNNQARLEIIGNYLDYYADKLDEEIGQSCPLVI